MNKRVQAVVIAGLLALGAGEATAQGVGENHNIRVERGGFYPPKVYVSVGDTLTFTNYINKDANLHSVNYGWRTDWRVDQIGYLSSKVVTIAADMERTLRAPCFNSNTPPWWGDPDDREWEISSENDGSMCNGWLYKRTHNYLQIEFGEAPDGS